MLLAKKKKKFPKSVMIILVITPLILHVFWIRSISKKATEMHEGKDLEIANLLRFNVNDQSASPIQVFGTYGDIFLPTINGIDRSYDLIVISATLDPLTVVDSLVYWQSNMLVRSYFDYAYSTEDKKMIESGVRSLIGRMMKDNKKYLEYLQEAPSEELERNKNYLLKLCEPYISVVPKDSRLSESGIRAYAVVPLFNGERISDETEREKRLKINVQTSVSRVLSDIKNMDKIRFIAFPGLAGTETLLDSKNYLSYHDSFSEILHAFQGRSIPENVERLYLVAWKKWDDKYPEEGKRALSALTNIYKESYEQKEGPRILSIITVAIFSISYVIWFIVFYSNTRSKYSKSDQSIISEIVNSYRFTLIVFIGAELAAFSPLLNALSSLFSFLFTKIPNYLFIFIELFSGIFAIALSHALLKVDFPKKSKTPVLK